MNRILLSLILTLLQPCSMRAQILVPIAANVAHGSGPGTTPSYSNNCEGSNNELHGTCVWAVTPSSTYAVVGVIWVGAGGSLSSVCDGTGTDGCTGSSTYTLQSVYANGSNFSSQVFYTCNFTGSTHLTLNLDTTRQYYVAAVSITGNSTSLCSDGYNKAQSTTGSSTSLLSGTVSTTNAGDLMIGLFTNECGGETWTSGQDGSGHTYTQRADVSGVVMLQTLSQSATGTYSAAATFNAACRWNAEVMAIK